MVACRGLRSGSDLWSWAGKAKQGRFQFRAVQLDVRDHDQTDAPLFKGAAGSLKSESFNAKAARPVMSDVRVNFLYAAIADAQGTIRSLDIRCGFLFVILLSPVAVADKVLGWVFQHHPWYVLVWVAICQVSWFAALACLFAATVAISNPADHVIVGNLHGTFYSGDLFKLHLKHIFFDKRVLATRDLEGEFRLIPTAEGATAKELTFEKMKLSFIRDIKRLRFNAGARLTVLAGLSAVVAYGLSLI